MRRCCCCLTPELQPSEHLKVEGSVWLPLNVASSGNVSSSSQAVGVTKIAKSVIAPLAQQHVSVFMLSTYQTDFILASSTLCCLLLPPAALWLKTKCIFDLFQKMVSVSSLNRHDVSSLSGFLAELTFDLQAGRRQTFESVVS